VLSPSWHSLALLTETQNSLMLFCMLATRSFLRASSMGLKCFSLDCATKLRACSRSRAASRPSVPLSLVWSSPLASYPRHTHRHKDIHLS
jgi:hypothetical protein